MTVFPPCQSDPICAVLDSSGLTNCGLILGIAAVSTDQLIRELKLYVENTAPHYTNTFGHLNGPIKIVWAHARAAESIRYLGIRPATSKPAGPKLSESRIFSHRLNILAVSQSGAGDRVRAWLTNNSPQENERRVENNCDTSSDNDPNPTQVSGDDSYRVTQTSSQSSQPSPLNVLLKATHSSTNKMPGQSKCSSPPPSTKRSYIKREKFVTMEDYKPPQTKRKPKHPRVDDLEKTKPLGAVTLVGMFSGASQLILDCSAASLAPDEFAALAERSLSNRCRTEAARVRVCRCAQDFLEFTLQRPNPLPFYGNAAVPAVVGWLDHVRLRGHTVPHLAKYCLMAFGEAMGISFPVDHPAVRSAARVDSLRVAKTAQAVPLNFIERLEALASSDNTKPGLQLAASILCLMIFASLRFSDLRDVSDLWTSNSAICGRSLNHKDKGGAIMCWAAPKEGLKSKGKWCLPALSFWNTVNPSLPKEGAASQGGNKFYFLFPYFDKEWAVDFARAATNGTAQATLTRLEEACELKGLGRTLHSPRSWFATCATQLAFKREDRTTLGRWAAGSVMPDRYDRGICVTELRLRDEILGQVKDGWRPQKAFEIPTSKDKIQNEAKESESDSTSVTSTASQFKTEVNIADLDTFV